MQDTFVHIWRLLSPAYEFTTPGRVQACRRLWESFDLRRQRFTYRTIRDKKRKGEHVNANPYFAIDDNSHEPEQLAKPAPPKNYNGSREFEAMVAKGCLVTANYNGETGIYTEADAVQHNMTIIKHLHP